MERERRCSACQGAMPTALLEGHYGQRIEIDLCPACHLIWFDETESVRLSGLGWVTLLRRMNAAPERATLEIPEPLGCLRCGAPCKPIRNLSRYGRSAGHECTKGHGYFQTFGQLLSERGLVRPIAARDRRALQSEGRGLGCLNCGAALPTGAGEDRCSHCQSPLLVFDVKRLLASLSVRHGLPLPDDGAQPVAWACKGCGAAVDPTRMTGCDHCGHAIVAPSLGAAMPLLDALEPQLLAMRPRAPRPHGERLRRADDFGATAFYRFIVAPFIHGDLARELDTDPARRTTVGFAGRRRGPKEGAGWPFVLGIAIAVALLLAVVHAIWRR